ncbi:MAG: phosphomethylpyrimidine synthase ThiC [Thermoplasmata archaeon]
MSLICEAESRITPEIECAAKWEGMDPDKLRRAIAAGRAVLPHNPAHSITRPAPIGEGISVKINANIGTSPDMIDRDLELEKAKVAIKYGADTIMDLSTGGDLKAIRAMLLKMVRIPLGTVPIYEVACRMGGRGGILNMTEDDIFSVIEEHAKQGVDFITVHCGVTKKTAQVLAEHPRITDVVSRGGAILLRWMAHTGNENPLFESYDYLLELAGRYELTLSLGDGLRPGCTADATDPAQLAELAVLGKLVRRAREAGVQTIVEGPGHVPLNQIEANVRLEKTICDGAPFYVLGPLVTDIAPGYDHITSAIGGALAAYYGADFLCCVTPSEHLSLPTVDDVREGVISGKIAAHAADLARGIDSDWDARMSAARKALDWQQMLDLCIDKTKATEIRNRFDSADSTVCTMCGEYCAMRLSEEALKQDKNTRK